ncbi:MAG: NusG domain II-containing protein [Pseudomonadota bacterium]|nr:NusG domain II-containing protein [Pseudomonadota bacterium]
MTRGDVLTIAAAAALIGILFARYWQAPVAATQFEVRVASETFGRYALDIDREIRIDGRVGPSMLKVENGRVRFISSPCRNQVCVHGGWFSHSGDAAACLPNRVSISLSGNAGEGLDAVSF